MKLSEYDVEKCEAEKNIFERRCKTRFLINEADFESLSNVICVFSNNVGCDVGFLNMRCLYNRKT